MLSTIEVIIIWYIPLTLVVFRILFRYFLMPLIYRRVKMPMMRSQLRGCPYARVTHTLWYNQIYAKLSNDCHYQLDEIDSKVQCFLLDEPACTLRSRAFFRSSQSSRIAKAQAA